MNENLKQNATDALAIVTKLRNAQVTGELLSKNTLTQKNMDEAGILSMNFLLKKLDKVVNGADDSKEAKSIDEKIEAAQKKLDDLVAKKAALGETVSDEAQIEEISNFITELDGSVIDAVAIAKVNAIAAKFGRKKGA